MVTLVALVLAFAVVHAGLGHAGLRLRVKDSLGRAYGPVYGSVSLLLLIAMIWAYRATDPVVVYDAPSWGRYANFALSFAGFLALGIFLFRGSWRQVLRYPMAIGVCLWSAGHLLANGDGRSLAFFGGLALAALAQVALSAVSGASVPADVRQGHNLLSMIAGIALYGIMTQLHYLVTGVPLLEVGP